MSKQLDVFGPDIVASEANPQAMPDTQNVATPVSRAVSELSAPQTDYVGSLIEKIVNQYEVLTTTDLRRALSKAMLKKPLDQEAMRADPLGNFCLSCLEENTVITEENLTEALTNLQNHTALKTKDGRPRESLAIDTPFAKYLLGFARDRKEQAILKTTLYNIFNLFYYATSLDSQKQEDLFEAFPPQRQDLRCLPGTSARATDMLTMLEAQEGNCFNRLMIDAHIAQRSYFTQESRKYLAENNQVHFSTFFDYITSVISREQATKNDALAPSLKSYLPAILKLEIFTEYSKKFRERLKRNINEEAKALAKKLPNF